MNVLRLARQVPILKRLVPSAAKRWAALTWPAEGKVLLRHGAMFRLDWRNYVERELAFFDYEAPQLARFLAEIGTADYALFIDVGANFGLYSLAVAARYPGRPVVAFEPDERNLERLRQNLALNRHAVTVRRDAASSRDGAVRFAPASDRSTGQSRVDASGIEVPSVRLDTVFNQSGASIALKIDVEGHELEVIEGAQRLLRHNRCFIQVECFPERIAALTAALREAGYAPAGEIENDRYFRRAGDS